MPQLEFLLLSPSAQVNRFRHDTQLSDGMMDRLDPLPQPQSAAESPSMLDLGSSPQIDVQVHESTDNANNNNKYKNMLRYMPNAEFRGELSSIGASVPNTFKHKSHPNAQTKDRIGLLYGDDESSPGLEPSSNPVKTSTMRGIELSNIEEVGSVEHDDGNTPSWMPQMLGQRWDVSGNASRSRLPPDGENLGLDFLNSQSNTLVHNPPQLDLSTPMWKKMTKGYQNNLAEHLLPLQQIFKSTDDSHSAPNSRQNSKVGQSAFALLSTISTPIATRETDIRLTQQQINRLEDILEQAKDKPDDYQIKGSPLKLFGSEYDTFTKSVLSKFVEKVRSNANSVLREQAPAPAQLQVPKLKIKNFTKSGDYTDQDFMKNANNIFANIQKGYNPRNVFENPTDRSLSFQRSLANTHNTATSTPKVERAQDLEDIASLDGYSSYSTDYDENSSAEELDIDKHPDSFPGDRNQYTSIEGTYLNDRNAEHTSNSENKEEQDSYTFDEDSDFNGDAVPLRGNAPFGKLPVGKVRAGSPQRRRSTEPNDDTSIFTSSSSSVKQFSDRRPIKVHAGHDSRAAELQQDTSNQFIKWKRASQLRLSSTDSSKANLRSTSKRNFIKGTVKPGDFPQEYGNMLYDNKNHRWVSNDKENHFAGSLDSIEDLVTSAELTNDPSQMTTEVSILKLNKKKGKKADKNLEVSFRVPNLATETKFLRHTYDVTNVSDVNNLSFSQGHKNMVSLITGSTNETLWDKITRIDLSNTGLEDVQMFETYLPALKRAHLSNNRIKYLEGLPQGLFVLDIANNRVENMTSFETFHDLQSLNCSFNRLENLSGLHNNVHLTHLDLNNNMINSIDGIKSIHNLVLLNISANNIAGELDFSDFDISKLQILSLAENRILDVKGLDMLPDLRVLDLRDNKLTKLSCEVRHPRLKKLLLQHNLIQELDVSSFPSLRVLRIDGNPLENITGLKNLRMLQEVCARCLTGEEAVLEKILDETDLISLDLTGNQTMSTMVASSSRQFLNLNRLNLSAVGLTSIPESFGEIFPNVRELNLNFNKLTDISGISKLGHLRKLSIFSNTLSRTEMVLKSLSNSRKTLQVLDLRLNLLNYEIYPYVFSPQELTDVNASSNKAESLIPLHDTDDIEMFAYHYETLVRGVDEWEERDTEFLIQLQTEGDHKKVADRLTYETIFVNFFPKLRDLDGRKIDEAKRSQMRERMLQRAPNSARLA